MENYIIQKKRIDLNQNKYDMRCFENATDENGKNEYRKAKNRVVRCKRELKELLEQEKMSVQKVEAKLKRMAGF